MQKRTIKRKRKHGNRRKYDEVWMVQNMEEHSVLLSNAILCCVNFRAGVEAQCHANRENQNGQRHKDAIT